MKQGFETEVHAHNTEEQVFIVLDGAGKLAIENENREISKGVAIYIPRKANHKIVATPPSFCNEKTALSVT
ncbi:unnamed protein product [marine sediment metagenome]|uniref:Cupin type-2 domain-containing protein n=1 Tax=marine sediment metagenome TaxID=412755 RepID=X1H7S7_9ZZZZ